MGQVVGAGRIREAIRFTIHSIWDEQNTKSVIQSKTGLIVFFMQQFDRDIGRPSTGNTTAHYRQFLLCFGRQSFDNIWKLTVFTIVNGKLDLGEFELAIDFDTIGTLPTWNVLLQLGMSGSLPLFFF